MTCQARGRQQNQPQWSGQRQPGPERAEQDREEEQKGHLARAPGTGHRTALVWELRPLPPTRTRSQDMPPEGSSRTTMVSCRELTQGGSRGGAREAGG